MRIADLIPAWRCDLSSNPKSEIRNPKSSNVKPRRQLSLLDVALHRARRKHRAHRGREPATAPRPAQSRRGAPRQTLAAHRADHRRRGAVFRAAQKSHRAKRHGVSRVPDGKSELDHFLDLPGARKRPHGARPDHDRAVGGIEPPLLVRPHARGATGRGKTARRNFFSRSNPVRCTSSA